MVVTSGWGNKEIYWDIGAPNGSTAEYRLQTNLDGTNLTILEYSKTNRKRSIWKMVRPIATSGSLNSLNVDEFKFPSYTWNNTGKYYDITLSEIIFIREIYEEERLIYEGYLAHKWGSLGNYPKIINTRMELQKNLQVEHGHRRTPLRNFSGRIKVTKETMQLQGVLLN